MPGKKGLNKSILDKVENSLKKEVNEKNSIVDFEARVEYHSGILEDDKGNDISHYDLDKPLDNRASNFVKAIHFKIKNRTLKTSNFKGNKITISVENSLPIIGQKYRDMLYNDLKNRIKEKIKNDAFRIQTLSVKKQKLHFDHRYKSKLSEEQYKDLIQLLDQDSSQPITFKSEILKHLQTKKSLTTTELLNLLESEKIIKFSNKKDKKTKILNLNKRITELEHEGKVICKGLSGTRIIKLSDGKKSIKENVTLTDELIKHLEAASNKTLTKGYFQDLMEKGLINFSNKNNYLNNILRTCKQKGWIEIKGRGKTAMITLKQKPTKNPLNKK